MSGRAGRRGLDDKGIVILMIDQKMVPAVGRNLVSRHFTCAGCRPRLSFNFLRYLFNPYTVPRLETTAQLH